MGTPHTGYDPDLHARRAAAFGAAAAEYAEHRPDYPADAAAWALEPAGPGPLHVLDLAAGTGKLSRPLVALGHRVTAVEPDEAMLAELRRHVPEATALAGSAERIPLPDASVDAVVVGQAIHWFDQAVALPEIARVLRPGGPLATLSNAEDEGVEWVAGLAKVSPTQASFTDWANRPGRRIEPHPAFSATENADFPHAQRRTAESLIATVATHSHILVMEPAEREAAKERIRAYLRSRPETCAGAFDLPLLTRVQRCVRAAG
ncbi:class I SAM-dependent methyltransferase [Streptomyces sp. NBC_01477]|uniref:class I SAM-dependent methyltransferase n=1 Tax=Streptomyces sp. NBC_01477 TaxID=2976015 RepID=UPI002E320D12|nr:class I SAM-dependent methyltransferase [Streptomyces sp. NBC_01477]